MENETLQNILEHVKVISEHPLFPFVGILVGLIGIILALLFYIRGKKQKIPRYEIRSNPIIEDSKSLLEGITILYKGEEQNIITSSRVAFWNAGNNTIRKKDIPTDLPLTIELHNNLDLLDASIVHMSHKSNNFQIDKPVIEDGRIIINFGIEYLDPGEGGIIQLIHNGKPSEQISVKGKIIDCDKIRRYESPIYRQLELFSNLKIPLLPISIKLLDSQLFGWFGVIVYFIGGLITILLPLLGVITWWVALISPLSFFASSVMYRAYAKVQMPSDIIEKL